MPDLHDQSNFFPSRKSLSCLWLLATSALWAVPGASAQDDAFELKVRPSICVSYDSASPCVMSMEVSWAGTRMADVCLREETNATPLRCWDDAREGRHEVQYADTTDVHYSLVDANTESVLAESEVVVINRDLRDSRKRRRHVWSIL